MIKFLDFQKKTGCLGFTLLELTLVMFFMALIAGLSTPFVMSTLDRMELQTSARKIASTLRYARNEAITSKKPVIFSGSLVRNQFWIKQGYKNETPKITSLVNPIRLDHFIEEGEDNFISDDEFTVTFFPQGNSSGGLIGININESKSSENYYAISIDPITGTTKIKQNK